MAASTADVKAAWWVANSDVCWAGSMADDSAVEWAASSADGLVVK